MGISPGLDANFYVYLYFRLDGSPLYVGKGYGSRWDNPSHQQFMSATNVARYESEEERTKTGAATREGLHKPETRKRHLKGLRKIWDRPGAREARSLMLVERYEDPAERAKLTEMCNTRWAKDGARERASAAAKTLWADPVYREKVTAANRERAAQIKREANGHFAGT